MSETGIEENLRTAPEKSSKRLVMIVLVLLSLLGLGAAYIFLFTNTGTNLLGGNSSTGTAQTLNGSEQDLLTNIEQRIMPMDEIIINIRDEQNQRLFKLNVSIELQNASDRGEADQMRLLLLDSFQSYLRSLRVSDIENSRAIYQIKEELLSRASAVLYPVPIKNILFREMLIT